MELDNILIGERIKKRRLEMGYKQMQIYNEIGISSGRMSDIESGKHSPSLITLYKLSKVLNCSIDWIVTGETPNMDTYNLSNLEEQLLKDFRKMTEYEQEELLEILNVKIKRKKEQLNKTVKSSTCVVENNSVKIG